MVKETYIKLFNTYNDEVKHIKASSHEPIDIQIQRALEEYSKYFLYAEQLSYFRLHTDELYK